MFITLALWVAAVLLCSSVRGTREGLISARVSTAFRSIPYSQDMSLDADGNVLVVSASTHCVHCGYLNGSIVIIAGAIDHSYGWVDGNALSARFMNPNGITCDAATNIAYISDTYNYRIRKLDLRSMNVTTLAGSGAAGSQDGIGAAARFDRPIGIVVERMIHVLYVADYGNNKVRKVDIATGQVTTIAATSASCTSLCMNRWGTLLYVSVTEAILRVRMSDYDVTVVAGSLASYGYTDDVGTSARFHLPYGISLTTNETLLIISDFYNFRIRCLDLVTQRVTTIAGSGLMGSNDAIGLAATFNYVYGLHWFCNTTSLFCGVLAADAQNNAVRFVQLEYYVTPTEEMSLTSTSSQSSPKLCSETSTSSHQSSRSLTRSSMVTSSRTAGTTFSRRTMTPSSQFTASTSKLGTASASATTSNSSAATRTALLLSASVTPTHVHRSLTLSTPLTARSVTTSSTCCTSISSSQSLFTASRTTHCALAAPMGQRSLSVLSPVDVNDPLLALPLNPAPPADDDNSPRDSVVAFGAPLSRSSVLRNARWIVNYSIVIGGTMMGNVSIVNAWRVVNATWDVLTISSPFPVLTATLPLTIISYNVVGRVQHILCAVDPPNATGMPQAWLPSTVSMSRLVTLRLNLAMQCPTNPNVVEVIVIETSSPGQSIEIATEVKAVSTAGLYMSLLSSLTVGTSLGRIAAVRSVVSCSSDGAIEGLVPLTGVTNCDGDEETLMEGARGSVLGSLILWTAGCAVGVLLTCGYSRATSKSLLHSMEMLGMPSL